MSTMVGIGPFITIPTLLAALGRAAVDDRMVRRPGHRDSRWDDLGELELRRRSPAPGGSYLYLREGFGRQTWGRFMAFLFIWQFILSGPLEIASGCIGFAQYMAYLRLPITPRQSQFVPAAVCILATALLYRRITAVGKITLFLWIGTMLTMAAVVIGGATHFNPKLAFDFPPGAFKFSWGFVLGIGAASRVGMYDYLGYYDVCYIGDEVKDPGRVIPRSILISLIVVAAFYFAINLSLIGVVPWREMKENSPVASMFMEKLYGGKVANVFTVMVLWTAVASIFALLLGYSRIPYAAARNGDFFRIFARLHPTKNFPHISLLVIGIVSVACSFLTLGTVIDALLITRILVQFIGQIFAVMLLRQRKPDMERPYRIWLYPLPSLVAAGGMDISVCDGGWEIDLNGVGDAGSGGDCISGVVEA